MNILKEHFCVPNKSHRTAIAYKIIIRKIIILSLLYLFSFPLLLFSQNNQIVNRDTSFTLNSAFQKIHDQYPAAQPVSPKINKKIISKFDLIYKTIGQRKLHVDLFQPRSIKKNLPCVIIIHGGGWASGNKKMEWPIATYLASLGMNALTVEYRLSPEAKYPAAVEDLHILIKWLKCNSKKYKIDSTRIALFGVSAGGHLAALIGLTSTVENKNGIAAIIDIDGVIDFTDPAESGKDIDPAKPSAGKKWLGYSFKENPSIWEEVSPLKYVTPNSPPIIFINSSLERYHAGRDKLIEIYKKNEIYYEVHTVPNTPHPFWLFHPWFEQVVDYTKNFLSKVFNLKMLE